MNVPKPVGIGFLSLGAVLVFTSFALVQRNRKLADLNYSYEGGLHLRVGEHVPPLSGVGASGQPVTIKYSSSQPETLLLVFSSTCGDCVVNWPNWREVVRNVAHVRIVAVTFDHTGLSSKYLAQIGLPDVHDILMPDPQTVVLYRFQYTPQTILIDSERKVEGIWSGVLSPGNVANIRRLTSEIQAMQFRSPVLSGGSDR